MLDALTNASLVVSFFMLYDCGNIPLYAKLNKFKINRAIIVLHHDMVEIVEFDF